MPLFNSRFQLHFLDHVEMSAPLFVSIFVVAASYVLRTTCAIGYKTARWTTLVEIGLFINFIRNTARLQGPDRLSWLHIDLPSWKSVIAFLAAVYLVFASLHKLVKPHEELGFVTRKTRSKSVRFAAGTKPASITRTEQSSNDVEATFYPCTTTHSRFFPVKHSFVYNYLLVGVPITDSGTIRPSRVFSVVDFKSTSCPWSLFSLHPKDYLARGDQTLKTKLSKFLEDHDLRIADYQLVYLVTAPRFLGYSFNPVSFWYLYTVDEVNQTRILQVVILEVNNTFDERWMYILKRPEDSVDNGDREQRYTFTINQIWNKELHVSPFNERDGGYTAYVRDPLAGSGPNVDMKITLHAVDADDKGAERLKSKLTARVWSMTDPMPVSKFTRLSTALFVLQFGYGCFLTFPKIVWEAVKLISWKKLTFFMRPEPVYGKAGVGRHDTALERYFETLFRTYLKDVTDQTSAPVKIDYHSSLPLSADIPCKDYEYFSNTLNTCEEVDIKTIQLTVSSPRFYSRFFCFGSLKTAVEMECYNLGDKTRRVLAREEHAALDVLEDSTPTVFKSYRVSWLDNVRWRLIGGLRKTLLVKECGEAIGPAPNDGYCVVDQILLEHHKDNAKFAGAYTNAVLKVLLAEIYGFGDEQYLKILLALVWLGMVLANVWLCQDLTFSPKGMARPLNRHPHGNSTKILPVGNAEGSMLHTSIKEWVVFGDFAALQLWWLGRLFLGV